MYRWSPAAPVEEVVGVVPDERSLRTDTAAAQDQAGDGPEIFGRFVDALWSTKEWRLPLNASEGLSHGGSQAPLRVHVSQADGQIL